MARPFSLFESFAGIIDDLRANGVVRATRGVSDVPVTYSRRTRVLYCVYTGAVSLTTHRVREVHRRLLQHHFTEQQAR
eukprot:31607-Eustigmatos_ZCMA.PRE.1